MKKFPRTLTLILTLTHTKYTTNSMILFHLLYLFTLFKYLLLKWLYIDFDESFFLYSNRINVCVKVPVKIPSIVKR